MGQNDLQWLEARPDIAALRLAAFDLNGIARGKRVPASHASKAFSGALRMPLSALNVDIWGADIHDSPLVFDTGDADGTLRPTERGLVPLSWFDTPSALLPLWMFNDDGTPFQGDARHALKAVLDRYRARGLTPVVATEMEFYLLNGSAALPTPPRSPATGQPLAALDVLSLAGLDEFDAFFTDLYAACAEMDIPADAAISEAGPGQFEINLLHVDDALKAADDAILFRMAVKGIARKHGMQASFMAKPYVDQPGNGMHVHFSVLDEAWENIFDDGTERGADALRHAVAGLLAAMPACALIFAPHGNSYRRLTPDSHAPTAAAWGYENRTAAIRIPGGSPVARRIEHRVAGGDANPHLMLAAILGAALSGIEDAMAPPAPITGNAYQAGAPQLPTTWEGAIARFETDPLVARLFPQELIRNMVLCKRQEMTRLADADKALEFSTLMRAL